MIPAPQGTGLVAGNELKKILAMAGIKDIYTKTFGKQRTSFNLVKACFEALKRTTRIIRIRGRVNIDKDIEETLDRLRLKRKYACVVIKGTKEELGMIKKVRNFVAFGEITPEVHEELKKKRGKKGADGKLKPFFRLHPPRGGIESKKHFGVGKGVLGNNKEKINDLVRRML